MFENKFSHYSLPSKWWPIFSSERCHSFLCWTVRQRSGFPLPACRLGHLRFFLVPTVCLGLCFPAPTFLCTTCRTSAQSCEFFLGRQVLARYPSLLSFIFSVSVKVFSVVLRTKYASIKSSTGFSHPPFLF